MPGIEEFEKRIDRELELLHQRLTERTQANREQFEVWVKTLVERLEYEKRNGFVHQEKVTEALQQQLDRRVLSLEAKLDAYVIAHQREHGQLANEYQRECQNTDTKLHESNQLRAQLLGERAGFVTRDQMDTTLTALRERMDAGLVLQNPTPQIDELRRRLEDSEARRANLDGRFWMLGAALSALVIVLNMVLAFILKSAHG